MIRLKKILPLLLTGLLFLFALLLTFYPILSSRYNEAHQTKARAEYEGILAQTNTEEFDRLRSAAVAYGEYPKQHEAGAKERICHGAGLSEH